MEAENLGKVIQGITYNLSLVSTVSMTFCLVAGLVLVVKSLFKLKQHSDTGGKTSLADALILLACGVSLLSIMSVIGIGKEVFGLGHVDTSKETDFKNVEKEPKY